MGCGRGGLKYPDPSVLDNSRRFDSEYTAACPEESKLSRRIGERFSYLPSHVVESNGETHKRLAILAKNLADECAVWLE